MALFTHTSQSCCNHNHSTEVILYTADSAARESYQPVVILLPDAMLAIESQPELFAESKVTTLLPPIVVASLVEAGSVMALRAPPVIA